MREKDLTHVVAAMGGYLWSLKVDGRDGDTCRPVPSSLDAEEAKVACLALAHWERRALAPPQICCRGKVGRGSWAWVGAVAPWEGGGGGRSRLGGWWWKEGGPCDGRRRRRESQP